MCGVGASVGSVLAIAGSYFVARFQATKQAQAALDSIKFERVHSRLQVAQALLELCSASCNALSYLRGRLNTREKVHAVAESGGLPNHMLEVLGLERRLDSIPLHELRGTLVRPALTLASVVRQLRLKIEMALQTHRAMGDAEFKDFFDVMAEGVTDLGRALDSSFRKEVEELEEEAGAVAPK